MTVGVALPGPFHRRVSLGVSDNPAPMQIAARCLSDKLVNNLLTTRCKRFRLTSDEGGGIRQGRPY